MATMNISLPDEMKEWVEAQAKSGLYSNSSDYVRDLIRKDTVKHEKIANMRRLVQEGLEGGISNKSFDEIIAEAEIKAKEKYGVRP